MQSAVLWIIAAVCLLQVYIRIHFFGHRREPEFALLSNWWRLHCCSGCTRRPSAHSSRLPSTMTTMMGSMRRCRPRRACSTIRTGAHWHRLFRRSTWSPLWAACSASSSSISCWTAWAIFCTVCCRVAVSSGLRSPCEPRFFVNIFCSRQFLYAFSVHLAWSS